MENTTKKELQVLEMILEFARDAVIKQLTNDIIFLEKRMNDAVGKYEGALISKEAARCIDVRSARVSAINSLEAAMVRKFPKLKRGIQTVAKKQRSIEDIRREAGKAAI